MFDALLREYSNVDSFCSLNQQVNSVSGYVRSAITNASGKFSFSNVPFNPYHLTATRKGFQPAVQDVNVQSGLPVRLKISLQLATVATQVTVTTQANDLIEKTPMAHTDVNQSLISNLPIQSPSIGLAQSTAPEAVLLAIPAVLLKVLLFVLVIVIVESSLAKLRLFRISEFLGAAFIIPAAALIPGMEL